MLKVAQCVHAAVLPIAETAVKVLIPAQNAPSIINLSRASVSSVLKVRFTAKCQWLGTTDSYEH